MKTETPGTDWLVIPAEPGEAAGAPLSSRQAHLAALVLESRQVPCRLEPAGAGWQLLVPAAWLGAAQEELRLFEEENRDWPPPPPPTSPPAGEFLAPLSILILLATFHNLTLLELPLFDHGTVDWIELGSAHAARIRAGEWWRLATALTLHSGWLHLLSNLALGGIFVLRLCRDLGSGLAWSLILGSGILGNLANAWLQPPGHRAIGASTAVFGAVGIVAAISLRRYRQSRRRPWPLPLAAGLALLALLGVGGEHTDLGAHLFGFLFGVGLGWAVQRRLERRGRPGRRLEALLAAASLAVALTAWWLALTSGR